MSARYNLLYSTSEYLTYSMCQVLGPVNTFSSIRCGLRNGGVQNINTLKAWLLPKAPESNRLRRDPEMHWLLTSLALSLALSESHLSNQRGWKLAGFSCFKVKAEILGRLMSVPKAAFTSSESFAVD